jgi:hypothetical protein
MAKHHVARLQVNDHIAEAVSGRSKDWIKMKNPAAREMVVKKAEKTRTHFIAQIRGAPEGPPSDFRAPLPLSTCQSALDWDPLPASKRDPFERRVLAVALAPSELAVVAETARARAGT